MLRRELPSQTYASLPAGTAFDLLGADGMDVTNMDRAEFLFANTGANSVVLAVLYSPMGTAFVEDATTYTVTASSSQRIVINPLTGTNLRLTATAGTGGSSGTLEGVAMRSGGG